jgi:molybdate transport system substrate-binding protein
MRVAGAVGVLLAGLLLVVVAGCGAAAPTVPQLSASPPDATSKGKVVVFAAASLRDAFEEMQGDLQSEGFTQVSYNFAGSQALVAQLGQGARADVFASADLASMEAAVAAGAVVSGTQEVLATNRLIVIVPPGEPSKVTTLKELAMPGIKLVVADPAVPIGSYSLQVLEKLSEAREFGTDFKDKVLANVISRESNVRQVVAKVQLGEADAGIVYSTDARPALPGSNPAVRALEISEEYNVVARYYIAPVKDAQHSETGRRFIDYALSAKGREILATFGFGLPQEER